MRSFLTLCLCAVTACATAHATRAKSGPVPAPSAMLFRTGLADVAFEAGAGWMLLPGKDQDALMVLVRADRPDVAMAAMIQEAPPGSTVEEVTTERAMTMVMAQTFFHAADLAPPTYLSEEESTFELRGADDAKHPMVMECRVKLASGHGEAYWVILIATGPAADAPMLSTLLERASKTLRVEPSDPQK